MICEYLDWAGTGPSLLAPPGEEGFPIRRIEGMARSMLDGVSLWAREYMYREPEIRSPVIMAHEAARAARMADQFELLVASPVLTGPLNLAQITLLCALHLREGKPPGNDWRAGRPQLAAWVDRLAERPSVVATVPPT